MTGDLWRLCAKMLPDADDEELRDVMILVVNERASRHDARNEAEQRKVMLADMKGVTS